MSAHPLLSATSHERDEWILARRGARNAVEARRPHACLQEEERAESGEVVSVATIFLVNRECPWRCLMCDLWQNTLTDSVPPGAIPEQIDFALNQLGHAPGTPGAARQIKLYNSGSFFDSRAIPVADHHAIAERTRSFERVIVECHPALVGERCLPFRDRLIGRLEVAMGLETACPEVLAALNKRMTLEDFARAARFLREHDISLRVFVLVKPPFMDESVALEWATRSIDFAFDCGASVVSLIPTRAGNGSLEELAAQGSFSPPRLVTLEAAHDYGVRLQRGRVFADMWDVERFTNCPRCVSARKERLRRMNLEQTVLPRIECDCRD
jgi:radical SAM enzyme (TIGR01210 family)